MSPARVDRLNLREAAEAAKTLGVTWTMSRGRRLWFTQAGRAAKFVLRVHPFSLDGDADRRFSNADALAAFIAACSPEAIIELLDELDRATTAAPDGSALLAERNDLAQRLVIAERTLAEHLAAQRDQSNAAATRLRVAEDLLYEVEPFVQQPALRTGISHSLAKRISTHLRGRRPTP